MFLRTSVARSVIRPSGRILARKGLQSAILPLRLKTGSLIATAKEQMLHPTPILYYRSFSSSIPSKEAAGQQQGSGEGGQIGQIEPKLSLTFTCTVTDCGHRSTHEFTRRSYEKGIVLVQCPGCKNRHLIADHLSWFTENASDPKTIEEMIEAKGGKVRRGVNYVDGNGYETMEIYEDADKPKSS